MAQIKKRAPDKYLVRIFLGRDSKGKRHYLNKTITGKKKTAVTWARNKEQERDLGLPLEATIITLAEYVGRWLSYWEQRVRPNTVLEYEQLMTCYVLPALGQRRLSQIEPLEIQNLYTELLKRGLSGQTIHHVHSRLVTAFNQAIRWRMLQQNPAAGITPPKIEKKEMRFLSPEEAKLFLAAAEENSQGTLLKFALVTGTRPEEYFGLQWKELDLGNPVRGVARIKRAVIQNRKGGGWSWGDVKTPKSVRDVYFPLFLVRELQRHRIKQQELRLRMGSYYVDHDLVFATKLGTPLHRKFITTYHLKPTLRRAGLSEELRLYDLRHSFVTLSLLSGVQPKVVSEQAGHSSVAFTLDTYAHVIKEQREGASDQLERLLFQGNGAQ